MLIPLVIHASLDSTVSDILSPKDVPLVVQSFFDHDRTVNHDGHEFGFGKGVALRSGYAHKFDGEVNLYEGIEGDGSMD